MVERIFNDPIAWGILAVFAVLSFVISLILKDTLKNPDDDSPPTWSTAIWRGVEAVILALLGGLIARAFISLLLGWANDSAGAGLAVGWAFFLLPGIIDTIPYLTHGHPVLTAPEILMMFATVVGGMCGAMSGLWRIYSWLGLGLIAFPLDVTWALAGNTGGCLFHLWNTVFGKHDDKVRPNTHLYPSGFTLLPGGAITLGSVMSNCAGHEDHETVHVWQNRAFGPLYTLTYLGWMLVWSVPGIVAGLIVAKGPSGLKKGPMRWCYFNNPWETWAYAVEGGTNARNSPGDPDDSRLTWPSLYVILWSIPFFLASTALAVFIFYSFWLNPQPAHKEAHPPSHKSTEPAPKSKPAPRPHERSCLDAFPLVVDKEKAIV